MLEEWLGAAVAFGRSVGAGAAGEEGSDNGFPVVQLMARNSTAAVKTVVRAPRRVILAAMCLGFKLVLLIVGWMWSSLLRPFQGNGKVFGVDHELQVYLVYLQGPIGRAGYPVQVLTLGLHPPGSC